MISPSRFSERKPSVSAGTRGKRGERPSGGWAVLRIPGAGALAIAAGCPVVRRLPGCLAPGPAPGPAKRWHAQRGRPASAGLQSTPAPSTSPGRTMPPLSQRIWRRSGCPGAWHRDLVVRVPGTGTRTGTREEVARAARETGFGWAAINASAVYVAEAHNATA